LQKLVVVDQLPAKTVWFGPEVILDSKAMRLTWSVKLVVGDWANWSTKRKSKSKRMEGLFNSIIMIVFQEREEESERIYKKEGVEINYKVLSGFYKRISILGGN
jgi:hypothetical protein